LQLYKSGKCTTLRAGESVALISPGFMRATVRYKGVKLFTPAEALRYMAL
jgi:transketolase C-terminal domain/subunit